MEEHVVVRQDRLGRWYFDLGRRTFYFWDKESAEKALQILLKGIA